MIIFGNLMGAQLPGMSSVWGYGVYLISGLLPWMAFANTVTRSSTVFLDKKNIISKIHVDLPTLPLFIVISETITFCVISYNISPHTSHDRVCIYPTTPAHPGRVSYPAGPCICARVLSCDVCHLSSGISKRWSASDSRSGSGSLLLSMSLRSFHLGPADPDMEPDAPRHLCVP